MRTAWNHDLVDPDEQSERHRHARKEAAGQALLKRSIAIFDELRHYADMRIMPSRWPFVVVNRPFRPGISA